MTDNVIGFAAARRQRDGDDAMFMLCPKCFEGEFAVVCRFAKGAPFVAALVCVTCEDAPETLVVNGFPQIAGASKL